MTYDSTSFQAGVSCQARDYVNFQRDNATRNLDSLICVQKTYVLWTTMIDRLRTEPILVLFNMCCSVAWNPGHIRYTTVSIFDRNLLDQKNDVGPIKQSLQFDCCKDEHSFACFKQGQDTQSCTITWHQFPAHRSKQGELTS